MTRIQIAVYNVLVAEVVVSDSRVADKLWAKWCVSRYNTKKPMGGANISNAHLPRMWDVPVGSQIKEEKVGDI